MVENINRLINKRWIVMIKWS